MNMTTLIVVYTHVEVQDLVYFYHVTKKKTSIQIHKKI